MVVRDAKVSIAMLMLGLAGFLFTLPLTPNTALAEDSDIPRIELAKAINKSGRQRMLSQRMVKAYCQIVLGVRDEEARVQLKKSISIFEKQHLWLKSMAPTKTISNQLDKVNTVWTKYKAIVTGPVSRKGARKLIPLSDVLLAEAHLVVEMMQKFSGDESARLVSISGRQRMLSQRVAKFYMLKELGFNDKIVNDSLNDAVGEFVAAHKELSISSLNTQQIRTKLEKADIQWQLYEHSVNKQGEESLAIFVAITSEKVLSLMNNTTGMYERVMAKKTNSENPFR